MLQSGWELWGWDCLPTSYGGLVESMETQEVAPPSLLVAARRGSLASARANLQPNCRGRPYLLRCQTTPSRADPPYPLHRQRLPRPWTAAGKRNFLNGQGLERV